MGGIKIDACDCCYGDENQLKMTKYLRKQVKSALKSLRSLTSSAEKVIRLKVNGKNARQSTEDEIRFEPESSALDHYLQILFFLQDIERSSRNILLPLLVSFASTDLQDSYDTFVAKEIFHIDFVRQVARSVSMETATSHDRTKDAFYTFVTCGKFGGIGTPKSHEFETLVADEFRRHASLEPHHPEFEGIHCRGCSHTDIAEMAIDRLTRNIVAAEGSIDHQKMRQYLPKFSVGDIEQKLSSYEKFVHDFEPVIRENYHLLMRNHGQDDLNTDKGQTECSSCQRSCPTVQIWSGKEDEITIEISYDKQ